MRTAAAPGHDTAVSNQEGPAAPTPPSGGPFPFSTRFRSRLVRWVTGCPEYRASISFRGPAAASCFAPRVLRRRRAGRRNRRARAGAAGLARLRPEADRAQRARRPRPRASAARSSSRARRTRPRAPCSSSPRTASRRRCTSAAARRRLRTVDATCPLVSKVHAEARRYAAEGYTILLVGHAGHEEVEGTLGRGAGGDHPRRDGRRCGARRGRRSGPRRLRDADDALGRRDRRDRRRAAPPVPRDRRARTRATSATRRRTASAR